MRYQSAMARLKLLFVVSECVPFAKTGGLGDVAGALPIALHQRGHDVRVLMPRYRSVKAMPAALMPKPMAVPTAWGEQWAAVYRSELAEGVPVYLLEHDTLFDREGLYGDAHGSFGDNLARYAFLSRSAFSLCDYLGFSPDLMHVHDWQAALVPVFARAFNHQVATVLTIHNLGYQGRFGMDQLGSLGLSADQSERLGLEYFGQINVLKGGVCCANKISTVSPRYAVEIQTPEGGAGIDGVIRSRADALVGILNGIDLASWDPETDPHIAAPFSADDLTGKALCKAALQAELGLEQRADVPLLGMVSRLAHQKGIDVLAEALDELLEQDLQIVVLGSGDGWAERLLRRLSETHPRFRARFGLDERLAHSIEAGADLFLMPSRYEPCGLNQMYSQRYGTLPIVRAVGGLDDTVEQELTGFKFTQLSGRALAAAVRLALSTYRHQHERFAAMQQRAMSKSMGWDRAATQYDALYRLALR